MVIILDGLRIDYDYELPISISNEAETRKQELVFVDRTVTGYEQLVANLGTLFSAGRSFEVYFINPEQNGLTLISEVLTRHEDIKAVHIISHGSRNGVKMGNLWLTINNLNFYRSVLHRWRNSLTDHADLLFYSCDLAGCKAGQDILTMFADQTGADVAASNDNTGSQALGGDWELEYSLGTVETTAPFTGELQANWDGLLATFTVSNTNNSGAGSLRQAILDANANAGPDVIYFNIPGPGPHTINVPSALPTITGAIIIDGTSDPDFAGSPIIELNGAGTGATVDGLVLGAGSDGSTIRGLVVNRFGRDGISGVANNVLIAGNYSGTDVSGTLDLGNNQDGIQADGDNWTIGGTSTADRNLVSGNGDDGIQLFGDGNIVLGNYIGTNIAGSFAIGNADDGIEIASTSTDNIVGGTANGSRNVISGNGGEGVLINITHSNKVLGNYIGVDATGAVELGNAGSGVNILAGANGNYIGAASANSGNVISGNAQNGIYLTGASTNQNIIEGNYIGTNAGGQDLGNGSSGILVASSATNNRFGGIQAGAGNTIAFNGSDGIWMNSDAGMDNAILGNSIFSNSGIGIDLLNDNVTANDIGDGDTGPNNLQNFPLLTSAVSLGGNLTITGSLNSTPSSYFRIEFFANTIADATGYGEGQRYLGFANLATNVSGIATFKTTLPATVTVGEFVSATAIKSDASFTAFTDASEFAQCMPVSAFNEVPSSAGGVVNGTVNTNYIFTWADFNISDPDSPITLETAVRLTNLPADGKLQYFNGTAWINVSVNQVITKAVIDAGYLRFMPDADESGYNGYPTPGVGNMKQDYAQFGYAPVQSTALTINNPDASANVLAENGWINPAIGWTSSGADAGAQNFGVATYSLDNDNGFFTNAGITASQTLAGTFSSASNYSLSIDLGWRAEAAYPTAPTFRVELWAGATRLGFINQTNVTLVKGSFVNGTLNITGSAFGGMGLDGQALQIRMVGVTSQSNYDNLRLTSFDPTSDLGGIATMTVDIAPEVTVGTPVFDMGATSTRCQGAGTVTYTATATNTTGITYTLDAASITGGNSIVAGTGAVTYVAGWSGTSIITASAEGVGGPKTAIHTVTITPTVGTPVFTLGATSTRCQGAGTVTYTATATNTTGITYTLDAASITGGNSILAGTGALTYAAGWSGTSIITASAAGCNGPKTAIHTVTITPTVGTPVFTLGATSTRCQGAGTVTYTATATNTTGITYTLDAASITGGNSIVAGTGAVTYVAGWSGTSIITAIAAGCDSKTSDLIVTTEDVTGPVITCPEDKTEYLNNNCEFIIPDYRSSISVYDNCDPAPSVFQSPSAGTILRGDGTLQPVTITSTDISGNTSSCIFNIILLDNTPPVVTCLPDTIVTVGEGVYKTEVILPAPLASDNCGIKSVINDFNGEENATGIYSVGITVVNYTVTDVNGNSTQCSQQITIRTSEEFPFGLVIPQGFSPNDDGLNDKFEILRIEAYPENELFVYNIWGYEVYHMSGYNNSWDGTASKGLSSGKKLPTGTYYYILKLG